MGRRVPIGDHNIIDFSLIHYSIVSLSFHMAWMAAIVATITVLCIRRKAKHSKHQSSHSSHNSKVKTSQAVKKSIMLDKSSPTIPMTTQEILQAGRTSWIVESDQEGNNENVQDNVTKRQAIKELPPPPTMKTLRETSSYNNLIRNVSMQRFEKSLSIKISRSVSMRHHHHSNKKRGKLKVDQDSVWSKAIILGEKCRPDDEDDTIFYDNKGNKISPYHKKTQSNFSASLSMTNSKVDHTHASPGLHNSKDRGIVIKDEGVLV